MKKFLPILLIAFVSMFIYSCDNDDDIVQDFDTYSQMRDVTGSFNSNNQFAFSTPISLEPTDVVLVYRRVGGNAWQILPKTYYLNDVTGLPNNRELDYNFVFNTGNVEIRTEANFNQATQIVPGEITDYLSNQTFRIVLVPASAGKTSNPVDYSDYNAVVKYYNLDESKVVKAIAN